MRARVTTTVELVEDRPQRGEVLASVTVTRERMVGIYPATYDATQAAANYAAGEAARDAIHGLMATRTIEEHA